MRILGVSAFYHDSAAALIDDGQIVAAAQEERFTRVKHDHEFPKNAMAYCLAEAGIRADQLDGVAFYDKPITKFHRILETYLSCAPRGLRSYLQAVPLWLRQKLWIPAEIEAVFESLGVSMPEKIYFPEHHVSHAASAYYPSPFADAAVLTVDGVGEWATSTICDADGKDLKVVREMHFPHSLGLLYSAFTYFTGFRVNSGEYKLMGLAPYGEPIYADKIKDHVIDVRDDGSFRMNLDLFGYLDGFTMTNDNFAKLFDGPARPAESTITRREMDLAKSIQVVTEEIVLKMARYARDVTGKKNLCMAGGVALNCVANGKLLKEKIFDRLWIQPAAGDAGGALGAALAAWHGAEQKPRPAPANGRDSMRGSYLGPVFSDDEIGAFLEAKGYPAQRFERDEWAKTIAKAIDDQKVIGLCHGRMEFGPRALGNRSIIGDARSPKMQSVMNLKIKYRESFRPFAPSCLKERVADFFEIDDESPYMLLVAPVREERCIAKQGDERSADLLEWVNRPRSDLPAITHVDYSARIQTVDKDVNPGYYAIIEAFEALTGQGIIINTSFNVRGEPIVCTPEDAYRCFMRTEMDRLVLGSFILEKEKQPEWHEKDDWRTEFKLD